MKYLSFEIKSVIRTQLLYEFFDTTIKPSFLNHLKQSNKWLNSIIIL